MPNIKAAKKALRQAKKKALANQLVRDGYKQAVKAVNKAVVTGKEVNESLRLAQQKLDKAAKKGVIKKNTAARKLSRMMKRVRATTTK